MIPLLRNGLDKIPPPLVEEVRNHLKEMLESGAIRHTLYSWDISQISF